jgi:hypothetical protein
VHNFLPLIDYGGSAAPIKGKNVLRHIHNLSHYLISPLRLSLSEIIDDWEEKIFSYRQYFEEEEEQFGVDESKRPPNAAFNPNALFNVDEAEGEIDYSLSPCMRT